MALPTVDEAKKINELKSTLPGFQFMQNVIGVNEGFDEPSIMCAARIFDDALAFTCGAARYAQANTYPKPSSIPDEIEELYELLEDIKFRKS